MSPILDEIKPETAERLAALAKARGKSIDEYLNSLLPPAYAHTSVCQPRVAKAVWRRASPGLRLRAIMMNHALPLRLTDGSSLRCVHSRRRSCSDIHLWTSPGLCKAASRSAVSGLISSRIGLISLLGSTWFLSAQSYCLERETVFRTLGDVPEPM